MGFVNGAEESAHFSTTVGTKQGGPISSMLFALYINDLLDKLNSS